MAKFLVTGGSGFIGSHLVAALLARGDNVVNLDVNPPANPAHAPRWRRLDLMDKPGVAGLLDDFRPDAIFNLAAIADLSTGVETMRVNTVGLQNLLECTAHISSKPRIVHTSTQLVAGAGHVATGPRDYAPYTPYGETKADSEEMLWNWPGEIEWVVIRPTLVWGPLNVAFAKATWYYLQRRWYFVPSRNSAIKTFSYVDSLVHQMLAAARAPAAAVDRKVFYGGDEVMDSAIWLDAFSRALTGKARAPTALCRLAGAGAGRRSAGEDRRAIADQQRPAVPHDSGLPDPAGRHAARSRQERAHHGPGDRRDGGVAAAGLSGPLPGSLESVRLRRRPFRASWTGRAGA